MFFAVCSAFIRTDCMPYNCESEENSAIKMQCRSREFRDPHNFVGLFPRPNLAFAKTQRHPRKSHGMSWNGSGYFIVASMFSYWNIGASIWLGVRPGAFYQKPGTPIIIRFWPQRQSSFEPDPEVQTHVLSGYGTTVRSCWLIGRGLQPTDVAISVLPSCHSS